MRTKIVGAVRVTLRKSQMLIRGSRFRNGKWAITAILAIVCCGGAKPAPKPNYDDAPPKVATYLRRRDEAAQYRISLLQKDLTTYSKQGDRKRVAKIKGRLKQLRQGNETVTPTIGMNVGDVGVIDVGSIKVSNVVDERNAILEFSTTIIGFGPRRAYVASAATKTVWLRGIDTSRFSDGATIKLSQVFEVTGTKSYTTSLGEKKTLVVFEPFDMKAVQEYLVSKSSAQPNRARPEPSGPRTVGEAPTEATAFDPEAPLGPDEGNRYSLADMRFLDWVNKTWENDARDGFKVSPLPHGHRFQCNFAGGYEQRMLAFPKEDPRRKRLLATFEVKSGECEIGIRPTNLAPRGARISMVFAPGRSYHVEFAIRDGQAVATIDGEPVEVSQDPEGNGIFAIVVSRRSDVVFEELSFVATAQQ